MSIKSATIGHYLTAAALLYTARKVANPYTDESIATNYPKILIDALKKYEKVAKRRQVITDSMFEYISQQRHDKSPNSLENTFQDWAVWSRYSGPRRSEWCQTTKTKYEKVEPGTIDEARAFIAADFTFYDATGKSVNPDRETVTRVAYAEVTWRYQKNGDNGETIKYYKDNKNTKWCPCRAIWNIFQRAKRLGIPAHEPIAKYKDKKGKIFFITDKDVKTILQSAAKEVLNITDETILSKWTSHSLRVTAANELHRLGFSDAFIKQRLRWRSDVFMIYPRHTIHVARQHSQEMSFSSENKALQESNLKKKNERLKGLIEYRSPTCDDILWEQQLYVSTAA